MDSIRFATECIIHALTGTWKMDEENDGEDEGKTTKMKNQVKRPSARRQIDKPSKPIIS